MFKDFISRTVRHALSGVGVSLITLGFASPEVVEAFVTSSVAIASGGAGVIGAIALSYASDHLKDLLKFD